MFSNPQVQDIAMLAILPMKRVKEKFNLPKNMHQILEVGEDHISSDSARIL